MAHGAARLAEVILGSFVLQQSQTLKKKKSFARRVGPFLNLLEIMSWISVQPGPCIVPEQDFSVGAG